MLLDGTSEGGAHVNKVSKANLMTSPRSSSSSPDPICTCQKDAAKLSLFRSHAAACYQCVWLFRLIKRHRLAWHQHNCSLCAIACALDHCVAMRVSPCLHFISSTFDTLEHQHRVDMFACSMGRESLVWRDHYSFPEDAAAAFQVNISHCLIGYFNIKLLRMMSRCQHK